MIGGLLVPTIAIGGLLIPTIAVGGLLIPTTAILISMSTLICSPRFSPSLAHQVSDMVLDILYILGVKLR